jgi:uncharacterized membrane protein
MELSRGDTSSLISPERLKTLADGVFAIVMTLLVLELSVPVITGKSGNAELTHKLLEMWPEFLIYALSFFILGVFWLIHHSIYSAVTHYDTTLVWLNIIFLMFVSLIPFSTALAGKNGFNTMTSVVYGVNMLLLFNLGWSSWAFITGKRRLVEKDIDPALVKGGSLMGLVYSLIMLPAIGISFVDPRISFIIYGLIVGVFIITSMLGKGEIAMIVPVSSEEKEQEEKEE